ncbi:hypothetical protein ElyMa_004678700 [Elysia marginata]|uniref:Uncharacterized protein n=1 Tax=Elysia marginata TaxID=1093978 RepID=A0AAV4I876_9GAST|nr:hypothetical protein ElyMa_004678700 [Elysia marginata]
MLLVALLEITWKQPSPISASLNFFTRSTGNNMAEDEEVALMDDVIEAEQKRFRFITRKSRSGSPMGDQTRMHAGTLLNKEL